MKELLESNRTYQKARLERRKAGGDSRLRHKAMTVRVSPAAKQCLVEHALRLSVKRGVRVSRNEAIQELFLLLPSLNQLKRTAPQASESRANYPAITIRVSPAAKQCMIEYILDLSMLRSERVSHNAAIQELFLQLPSIKHLENSKAVRGAES